MRLRILALLVFTAAWGLGFIGFYKQTRAPRLATPKNIHGLVILTGGDSRIGNGLKIFGDTDAARVLISGIDQSVTLSDLKNHYFKGSEKALSLVDFGYGAISTYSNALEARLWIRNHDFKRIGLVTSELHMPRSLLVFKRIMPSVEIVPLAVESRRKSVFAILTEFHKFYLTKIMSSVFGE